MDTIKYFFCFWSCYSMKPIDLVRGNLYCSKKILIGYNAFLFAKKLSISTFSEQLMILALLAAQVLAKPLQ